MFLHCVIITLLVSFTTFGIFWGWSLRQLIRPLSSHNEQTATTFRSSKSKCHDVRRWIYKSKLCIGELNFKLCCSMKVCVQKRDMRLCVRIHTDCDEQSGIFFGQDCVRLPARTHEVRRLLVCARGSEGKWHLTHSRCKYAQIHSYPALEGLTQ